MVHTWVSGWEPEWDLVPPSCWDGSVLWLLGRVCRPVWLSLQTVEHGFPHQPSALGYSPSLRILAIGTRSGAVKLYPFPAPSSRPGKAWKGRGPRPPRRKQSKLGMALLTQGRPT